MATLQHPGAALAAAILGICAGCATPVVTYSPAGGQSVVYSQGVGTITARAPGAVITIYPTFRYQSPSDIPTFTLMVQNTSDHSIDFDPETLGASIDSSQCHIYTLEERVAEIRKIARRRQITLAIVGGLAAVGAGYAASHQTTTYSGYGYVGNRAFYTAGTVQTYDPAAGIFAGVAVGAVTGVGIHQIAKAAGQEEQAAQGIFQHTTIAPGTTAVGQLELRVPSANFTSIDLTVPVEGTGSQFQFFRKSTL